MHIARADSLTDVLLEGIYKRPLLILSCFATDLACNFAKYKVSTSSIPNDTGEGGGGFERDHVVITISNHYNNAFAFKQPMQSIK